uniref:Uncharacterized protein n=1 Tax=Eucampia antarctica TaxID=49252 RepID=A0A7S2WKD7_9STRA|mmetsp:Transcript_4070/g.3855  ORF Transcript_4070/g.3855 Transcript_4070/m.3855 type:complete len:105 (+) Transcript_4070:54-368(+)
MGLFSKFQCFSKKTETEVLGEPSTPVKPSTVETKVVAPVEAATPETSVVEERSVQSAPSEEKSVGKVDIIEKNASSEKAETEDTTVQDPAPSASFTEDLKKNGI